MNALTLTANQTLSLDELAEEDLAKVFIRTLLASTTSENIEQNTDFLYSLITGGEL